jgi:hypothetical protein
MQIPTRRPLWPVPVLELAPMEGRAGDASAQEFCRRNQRTPSFSDGCSTRHPRTGNAPILVLAPRETLRHLRRQSFRGPLSTPSRLSLGLRSMPASGGPLPFLDVCGRRVSYTNPTSTEAAERQRSALSGRLIDAPADHREGWTVIIRSRRRSAQIATFADGVRDCDFRTSVLLTRTLSASCRGRASRRRWCRSITGSTNRPAPQNRNESDASGSAALPTVTEYGIM